MYIHILYNLKTARHILNLLKYFYQNFKANFVHTDEALEEFPLKLRTRQLFPLLIVKKLMKLKLHTKVLFLLKYNITAL